MERSMSDGYPFIFQMIDRSESDEYLKEALQYRFKSEKSHHTYIVRVECYIKHAYCVKFFDKANINSKNKFYRRFVLSTVSENKFDHYRRNDLSLYILVNKAYIEDTATYAGELASIVQRYL